MIACVAIVGKENDPLYLRTFVDDMPSSSSSSSSSSPPSSSTSSPTHSQSNYSTSTTSTSSNTISSTCGPTGTSPQDSLLKFHYHVHTSLDVIDEKIKRSYAGPSNVPSNPTDLYLGLLFAVEDYKVYGYITNTKIKFIVILKDSTVDTNIKSWFRDFHSLFVLTMSNPFCTPNARIESQTFASELYKLVMNYNR